MQKKQFSDCPFQNFFGFWAKFFSDFGGNSSKSCQNYLLRVQRNNLWLEKIFKKFWFVLDFLKKPLAWFSIIYLRVQSKNCGRNSFLIFLFRFCSDFERKIFQTFGQKTSKSCQNYLLRVHRNNLWLQIFLKSCEPFWIFYRNFWHGFQNSLYVSRVKIALETFFLFLFSDFFRILSETSFRLSAKKLQKVVKTTFCVSTGTTCGFKFLRKFWTFLDFLQKLLAWFSKFYLRVQSKKCVRNSFLIFLFRFFSDFERKFFQTFGRKTSRLCQNYLLRVQKKNLWLEFFF